MKRVNFWEFNKKPLSIRIIISLLFFYGTINLTFNFIDFLFVQHSGGEWITLSFPLWFDMLGFVAYLLFLCFPVIYYLLAIAIWKGKMWTYWITIILLVFSFVGAISALSYVNENLPVLFNKDSPFSSTADSPTTWILDNNNLDFPSVNSLFIARALIIKSYLKVLVEIVGFGFLLFVVLCKKSYFGNTNLKKINK